MYFVIRHALLSHSFSICRNVHEDKMNVKGWYSLMPECESSNSHVPMCYFTVSCTMTSQVPQQTSTSFICTQPLIKSMSYSPDKSGICYLWQKSGLLESVMFRRHEFLNLLIFQHLLYWKMVNWLGVKVVMFCFSKEDEFFSFCVFF